MIPVIPEPDGASDARVARRRAAKGRLGSGAEAPKHKRKWRASDGRAAETRGDGGGRSTEPCIRNDCKADMRMDRPAPNTLRARTDVQRGTTRHVRIAAEVQNRTSGTTCVCKCEKMNAIVHRCICERED